MEITIARLMLPEALDVFREDGAWGRLFCEFEDGDPWRLRVTRTWGTLTAADIPPELLWHELDLALPTAGAKVVEDATGGEWRLARRDIPEHIGVFPRAGGTQGWARAIHHTHARTVSWINTSTSWGGGLVTFGQLTAHPEKAATLVAAEYADETLLLQESDASALPRELIVWAASRLGVEPTKGGRLHVEHADGTRTIRRAK